MQTIEPYINMERPRGQFEYKGPTSTELLNLVYGYGPHRSITFASIPYSRSARDRLVRLSSFVLSYFLIMQKYNRTVILGPAQDCAILVHQTNRRPP